MATYAEIERERVTTGKYVKYNYNKMHPDIPDEFNPEYNWCKYWVAGLGNGAPSRLDVYNENIQNHNQYTPNGNDNFSKIVDAIGDSHPETLEYFRRITTINFRGDQTCQLMIYGGATIDFDALINDLNDAKNNDGRISEILHKLTKQVNAAALNGVISKLYNTANAIAQNHANIPNNADKIVENDVTRLYYSIINGSKRNYPVDIPEDPIKFKLVEELNNRVEEAAKLKNLPQNKVRSVLNNMFEELRTTINKRINTQQSR